MTAPFNPKFSSNPSLTESRPSPVGDEATLASPNEPEALGSLHLLGKSSGRGHALLTPLQHLVAKDGWLAWFQVLMDMPSAYRWLGGGISLLTLGLAGVVILISNQYQENMAKNYDQLGQLLASVVALPAQQVLQNPKDAQARHYLITTAKHLTTQANDVASIELFELGGKRVFDYYSGGLRLSQAQQLTDYTLALRHPSTKAPLGELHLKLTGDTLQGLIASTKPVIITPFVFCFLLAVIFSSFISFIWSRHLIVLVQGVKQLAEGNFGVRIHTQALWGQVLQLAEVFNMMAARLQVYEDKNIDALTLERNRLEAIVLSIADGVLVCNDQYRVVLVNDTAATLLALSDKEALCGLQLNDYLNDEGDCCFAPLLEAYTAHQQDASYMAKHQPLGANLALGQAVQTTELSLHGRQLRVQLSPVFNQRKRHLGTVLTLHDITKEKEVDQLKSQFISNVSHELRTPVTSIKSYMDTLHHHGNLLDEATRQEFMQTLHDEIDRLMRLVNDILDFSRLSEGERPLDMMAESLAPMVNMVLRSMHVLMEQKQLTLSTALESNLPMVWIHPDTIERVLRNLISNAVKYTPEGGHIKVALEYVRATTPQGQACIELRVEDTGIGIAPEHLERLFDRFYRVEKKVHTIKGTGLGLHLVKVAIEKHHEGHVFVRSKEGDGSTFGFRLPVHDTTQSPTP
ncbi:MAG: ATP-binding protein [Vampirovibrionales bacterium]